jgi:hypothetical protein
LAFELIIKDITKIGTVEGYLWRKRRVNGDKGEGIWLMGFKHIYNIKQLILLQLL